MIQVHFRSWSTYLGAAALFGSLAACTVAAPKRTPLNTTDDTTEQPTQSTDGTDPVVAENPNSGAFGNTSSSSSGNTIANRTFCDGEVKAGDLAITEIMITSKSGSGDAGEWAEITSTRDCWLHLEGVTVESPRGSAADTASFDGAFDLAPGATFLVADSNDATKNNSLPGEVISWDTTDVLKNDGDTISVKLGDVVIDSVTYPSLQQSSTGTAVAFPADCDSGARTDWLKWTASTATFDGTLHGTPNAKNTDVACK